MRGRLVLAAMRGGPRSGLILQIERVTLRYSGLRIRCPATFRIVRRCAPMAYLDAELTLTRDVPCLAVVQRQRRLPASRRSTEIECWRAVIAIAVAVIASRDLRGGPE